MRGKNMAESGKMKKMMIVCPSWTLCSSLYKYGGMLKIEGNIQVDSYELVSIAIVQKWQFYIAQPNKIIMCLLAFLSVLWLGVWMV